VKIGDTIEIMHIDADTAHDLYATDEAHSFDLSGMQHGDNYDFVVARSGTFVIHCYSMDHMVITVHATE